MEPTKTGTEQGQGEVLPLPEPAVKAVKSFLRRSAERLSYLGHCWEQGVNAKECGFARVSPYYENIEADLFWFSGFDGLSLEATMQIHYPDQNRIPEALHENCN